MSDNDTLVCTECGNSKFTARLNTLTRYTYQAHTNYGQPWQTDSQVIDGGDLGDVDEFECTDCGETFENLDGGNLTTREAWVAMVEADWSNG